MLFVCHVCGKQYEEKIGAYHDSQLGGKHIDGVYHKYMACRGHKPNEIREAFNKLTGLNYPPLNEDGSVRTTH